MIVRTLKRSLVFEINTAGCQEIMPSTAIAARVTSPLGEGEKVAEGRMRGLTGSKRDVSEIGRASHPPHPHPLPGGKLVKLEN